MLRVQRPQLRVPLRGELLRGLQGAWGRGGPGGERGEQGPSTWRRPWGVPGTLGTCPQKRGPAPRPTRGMRSRHWEAVMGAPGGTAGPVGGVGPPWGMGTPQGQWEPSGKWEPPKPCAPPWDTGEPCWDPWGCDTRAPSLGVPWPPPTPRFPAPGVFPAEHPEEHGVHVSPGAELPDRQGHAEPVPVLPPPEVLPGRNVQGR